MKARRLSIVVGILTSAWGCGSNTPPDGLTSGPREAKVKASSNPSGCLQWTLTATPPSPEPSGTPIVLAADAGCVPTPEGEYRFLYKPIGGESCGDGDGCGPWIELRGWGEAKFTFDTTGLVPGRYRLRAQGWTEGEGNPSRTLTYEFTEPCAPGYHSEGFDVCVDIDECLTGNGACDPLVTCTNTEGSRICGDCPEGYTGTGDTACMLPFTASELVGRPTDHSVTINVMAGKDSGGVFQALEAYFEYGTTPGTYAGSTTPAMFADGVIETVIDGLALDTRYHYRMRYRPSGSTAPFLARDEHAFQTQRPAGSTFTFAVQSDSHQGYAAFYSDALYNVTMGNIAGEQPDFLLDLGDTVSTDDATETLGSVRQKYLNQRTVFDLAAHSMPVFLALGNHENEEGWNLDDMDATTGRASSLPVLGANGRKRFFLNPVPDSFYTGNTDATVTEIDDDHLKEDYYAFEWGNALFVVIDPYWYTMKKPFTGSLGGEKDDEVVGNRWDWTLGDQQYDWLKQTLESSTATFKFVFSHQATGGTDNYVRAGAIGAKYCEWGGYDTDGTTWAFASHRPGWEMPIHQLFVHTNVTAFFHGHDHVFAKEVLDGIVYQELPHAANPDYGTGFATNQADYADAVGNNAFYNNSGHVRLTVTPTSVMAEYVRSFLPGEGSNGEVAYSYEMLPCDQRDSDGDGAMDCSDTDGCPGDANKTAPGVCGCGNLDIDSDGDTVLDCQDGCPTDAAKTAPGVCGCGLAESEPCNFMVVRVGTGNSALNYMSTAAFIEERRLGDGSLVNTIPLPIAASGANKPLTLSGALPVEGTLRRSVDGRYLTMSGFAWAPGRVAVGTTPSSTVNRVVARIDANHAVDTTTLFATAFSGSGASFANDRTVVSVDGSAFWSAGAGVSNSGGLWYIPFGTSSATQILGQSGNPPDAVRTCDIFDGQLYAANNLDPFQGIFTVGTGLPTTQDMATMLPGFGATTSPSPVDFTMLDRDGDGSADTIYVSDDRTTGGGGIQKWTFDGTTWNLAYTLSPGSTTGIRHLLAIEAPAGVVLVGGTTDSYNSIVRVFDTGDGSAITTLVPAGTNIAYRGVALPPVP